MTDDIWQLAAEAADAESGYLQNAGGIADQPAAWVRGWRQFKAEQAQWKARLTQQKEPTT